MGRLLALDFGLRRIGAAISDPSRIIATPLEVHERRGAERDAAHYRELIANEGIERIVVGLPLHNSGAEGDLAREARAFGAWLYSVTGLVVSFFDERYTTRQAEEILRGQGLKSRARQSRRDMIAAQVLLQDYIESGCPETEAPAAPLDDE